MLGPGFAPESSSEYAAPSSSREEELQLRRSSRLINRFWNESVHCVEVSNLTVKIDIKQENAAPLLFFLEERLS